MPQAPDGSAEQLVLALPPRGRRWVIPGGEDLDDETVLYVITTPDDGPSRRYRVTIPLSVADDGSLVAGLPAAEEWFGEP